MRLILILLSILSCQSISNETGSGGDWKNGSSASASTPPLVHHHHGEGGGEDQHVPFFLPFLSGVHLDLNGSSGGTGNSWTGAGGGGGSTNSYNGTSPHYQSKSRIVDTKYGKVQGLAITLFPNQGGGGQHHSAKGNNPLKNKHVEVFLNIPYASPPIKAYRFYPTQTPVPWEGIRSAVKPGFVCPQMMPDIRNETAALKDMPKGYLEYLRRVEPYLRNQSEDCLYLNVFSPYGTELKLRPVMVFIHGGRFSWGSGNLSDGTVLSAYADIVFVTINYRLGVLGFLNANPSPTSKPRVANYGLMDQIAALQWIKENIMFFGGDPENITLMGYEAGAACIHFLMSSPAVTPGLFHRSILIAGSSRAPWALVSDPSAVALALAEALNCSLTGLSNNNSTGSNGTNSLGSLLGVGSSSSRDGQGAGQGGSHGKSGGMFGASAPDPIVECLKNKHFSYFSKLPPPKFSVDFGPSIDGVVIKPNYRSASEGGGAMGKRDIGKKYDLLFGLSSLEKMTAFSEDDLKLGFEAERRDAILRTLIRNSYRFHLNEIFATITNEYIDWERSNQHPITTRDLTLNAVTDCLSLAPVIAAAELQQSNKAFFYVFDHSTKDGLYNYNYTKSGAAGGEELNYMFGYPIVDQVVGQVLPFVPTPIPIPSNYTKSEMALSELFMTFLSNFVHTGDPNEPLKREGAWPVSKESTRSRNLVWEPYDRLHQKYLEISANKIRSRSHYRAHQMAIWLRLVPELQRSGAHYASNVHSRMIGGNDPSLYVGSLRLPHEEEILNNPQYIDLGFGGVEEATYNGNPPSPPTTCLSPLSSSSASSGGAANAANERGNETLMEFSSFSPYSTALSATIAIGCSLLILNVFIFALVYYQRDKKRAEVIKANNQNKNGDGQGREKNESANKFGEVPELLKSNSTTATSLHHSESQGHSMSSAHSHSSHQNLSLGHQGILLSPQQVHSYHQGLREGMLQGGMGTLPRSNGGIGMVGTLPKPPPPPRSFTNFSTLPHKISTPGGPSSGHHLSQQQQQSQMTSSTYTTFDELKV